MTNEEKSAAMKTRNDEIVAYYQAGNKLKACASRFKLGRQRIYIILQAAGAWIPYVKGDRTKFIGVNVSQETKEAIASRAEKEGVSVSKFVSDRLDQAVAE